MIRIPSTSLSTLASAALLSLSGLTAACGGSGWRPSSAAQETAQPQTEAHDTVSRFVTADGRLRHYFDEAHAYAVFPRVGKGGFWLGGLYGEGDVYERGRHVGRASVTAVTAGPQIGGQAYSEVIFFANEQALREFREGRFEFGAQATAVAGDQGAGRNAAYNNGVAVFTLARGGLMAEVAVAGQKFCFVPTRG